MTKIINANNEQWILIEKDGYTLVDCGKKVKRLPFNVKDAIVGINYPPMHPRCRSTTIPIIEF